MTRKPGQKAARFGEKGMRLARSWETLLLLVETSTPLTAQEINTRIHSAYPFCDHTCSVQTTREDLKTLQKSGFPVVMVDDQGQEIDPETLDSPQGRLKNVRWQIRDVERMGQPTSPHHRNPTSTDLIALALCRALLNDEMLPRDYPLYRTIGRLLNELQLRLNQALRTGESEIIDLPGKIQRLGRRFTGKTVDTGVFTTIATAISRRQVLVGEYQNREGECKQVEIAPLAVWFTEGRAYLLAAGAADQKIRTWRLERLARLKVDPGRAAPEIDESSVQSHIRASFKGFVAPSIAIRLRVQPQVAYLFHEFQYHPSQRLTRNEDGSLDVHLECSTGWGFEEWLLGFGEFVVVMEPEALRQRIMERLLSALDRYRYHP